MKISSHMPRRSVAWSGGEFRARQLLVRRRHLRGDAPLSPGQPLPLLPLSQALRNVWVDSGTRRAFSVSAPVGRAADSRVLAGGRQGEGVLQRVRLVALRRRLAGGGGNLGAARLPRRPLRGSPAGRPPP